MSPKIVFASRIFIVDDHAVVREGLAKLINQEKDLKVCGEADSPETTMKTLATLQAEIVIVDISLGAANGLDLIKSIRAFWPTLPVLVFTMHEEDHYAERAIRAGASGFVMKSEPPAVLIQAIRKVLQGKLYLSERMTERMLEKSLGHYGVEENHDLANLSDREFQVFGLIGQGKSNREIAKELNLSVKTIDAVKENLKRKLNLPSTAELTCYAVGHFR